MKKTLLSIAAMAIACIANPAANGDQIRIEIENTAPDGGFYFTPVFLGFHDGSYDLFDAGGFSSGSLTALAEGGDTSGVSGDLLAGQATAQAATVLGNSAGPPPFDPGETIETVFNVDSSTQRFLTYASMVIPSNDAFFGNDEALELFNSNGNFVGPFSFDITAAMIYDAGTEVNDINGGAAFSANGGTSVDENLPISLIDLADLNAFVGSGTGAGTTILSGLSPDTVVARITVSVPEPGSAAVLGLVGLAGLVRRRR